MAKKRKRETLGKATVESLREFVKSPRAAKAMAYVPDAYLRALEELVEPAREMHAVYQPITIRHEFIDDCMAKALAKVSKAYMRYTRNGGPR